MKPSAPSSLDFGAFGSTISCRLWGGGWGSGRALTAARRWFQRWEARLSRFRPESELSALNGSRRPCARLSATLTSALGCALEQARGTGGLVTPTLLEAMESIGYDRSFELVSASTTPSRAYSSAPATSHDYRDLRLDRAARVLERPPGVRLDLGGTAKGWAADVASARLAGIGPNLVDAGGDIAVSGPQPGGEPWPVAVACPYRPDEAIDVIYLERGGVATSGRDHRQWFQGEERRHHILDPRTGAPAQTDVLSATVVAPSACRAEAAAKAVVILGSAAGLAWVDGQPDLAALAVLEDGDVVASASFGRFSLGWCVPSQARGPGAEGTG